MTNNKPAPEDGNGDSSFLGCGDHRNRCGCSDNPASCKTPPKEVVDDGSMCRFSPPPNFKLGEILGEGEKAFLRSIVSEAK